MLAPFFFEEGVGLLATCIGELAMTVYHGILASRPSIALLWKLMKRMANLELTRKILRHAPQRFGETHTCRH